MSDERVQIFTEDGFRDPESGNFRWGWQCVCGDEETRYGNATTARAAADNHAALCNARSRVPADTDTGR
jgi:hypothetical protein